MSNWETMREIMWWNDYYRDHDIPRPNKLGPYNSREEGELIGTIVYDFKDKEIKIIRERDALQQRLVNVLQKRLESMKYLS